MTNYLIHVDENQEGLRIDTFLSSNLEISRTKVASDIEAGAVIVNGKIASKSYRLNLNDEIKYAPIEKTIVDPKDQVIDIKVLYSDDDIVVVDKPFGVAAHASPGWEGPTVTASISAKGHRISTSGVPERQGIVQRLDVGTSGVMVDAPISRHPQENYKYAVVQGGRESITHYETLEAFPYASLLKIELETGRTHQIRVHMSAIKHPCVGDPMYGADPKLAEKLGLTRQWLHATSLTFKHPRTGAEVTFDSPYPQDLASSLKRVAEVFK
jgi:23S rRNA pseudouridine1911/1915/1917 synthase